MNSQVNKSSSEFWNNLKVTWQQCADLPKNYWVPLSVAKYEENVYASGGSGGDGFLFMYDPNKDHWSTLPELPCWYFSLVSVTEKKQLLAIGGVTNSNGVEEASNKVFLWDEKYKKWLTPYPNMPTARWNCLTVSHGFTVIVAGGAIVQDPFTITRSVEVLHINDNNLRDSYWSVVEQLPHVVYHAKSFIVNDKLYIAQGYNTKTPTNCNVVTASLPELLQSSNNSPTRGQVWNKLPDMPYSSYSINHYQGHLITFTGSHKVEQSDIDKPVWELVSLIHIYNPETTTWDCVGDIPVGYLLGMSVHIRENKILFIGGLNGTLDLSKDDNMISSCQILTLTPQ